MWIEIVDTSAKSAGWKIADIIASELGGGWKVTKEDPEVGSSAVTVASITNSGFDTSMTIKVNGNSVYIYYNCGGQSIESTFGVLGNNENSYILRLEIYKSTKGTTFAIALFDYCNINHSGSSDRLKYIVAKNAKGEDAILSAELPTTNSADANKTRITVVKKGFISSYYYPSTEVSDIQINSNIVVVSKMFDWDAKCMYNDLYEIRMSPRIYRKLFEINGKKYIGITNKSGCYGGLAFQVAN